MPSVPFFDDFLGDVMPHIHVEYSDNVQFAAKPLLLAINQAFIAAGYATDPSDVKSRAVCQSDYVVGVELESQHAYVHAKVSLLAGRSDTLKAEIADLVLSILEQHVPKQQDVHLQLCVELLDMPRNSYRKSKVQA